MVNLQGVLVARAHVTPSQMVLSVAKQGDRVEVSCTLFRGGSETTPFGASTLVGLETSYVKQPAEHYVKPTQATNKPNFLQFIMYLSPILRLRPRVTMVAAIHRPF